MVTLDSLKENTTGKLTAEGVRLIARLLSREVTAPSMVADDDGWHILPDSDGGNPGKIVLLRSIELAAVGYERDKIMAQELRYKDSPPQVGRVEAFGSKFEVYPFITHSYSSYDFFRSVIPLVVEPDEEELNVNAFFAYEIVQIGGYWQLKHVLRLPAGIQATDVNNIDYAGGSST